MEELDDNALLDSVTFYTKAHQNRFDAIISSNGVTDKIASGTLDQLLFHLPRLSDSQSRSSSDCFKLELTNTDNDVSWFTKSTVSRFLCLISSSDWLKSATSTENEISQLEDARNFHLALYTKDHVNVQGVSADVGNPDEAGATPRVKSDASADPTKNDLLRALDLRLLALKEEISSSFDRALGFVPSTDLISDLMSFCDYCGASKMRDHLVKYLESRQIDRPLVNSGNELLGKSGRTTSESIPQAYLQDKDLNFARTNSTLAKIALAERQISSESEDSDSSEGTKTSADRSRSLIRAPSPRRSASPMRRVQIGRSGSRRPAAVAIRSLNYFPPREKLPLKDTNIDVSSSCEAEQEKPSNRTEASARRMSVQDAINLFERKKMEESLSGHIRRSSSEVPFIAAKPVLRRWSSGMCDANKQEPEVTNSVDVTDTAEEEKNIVPEDPKTEIAQCLVPSNEETEEKVSETSEWSKKKEAELNQMLVKLMETKSSKYGNNPPPLSQKREPSKQQKEKTEISRKLGEKGTVKPRSTVEVNSQRKMRTVSKADPPAQAQKNRRNSSPPVLTKKDPPKPTLTKKASPKSALPLIRSSLPSNSYTKTAATPGKPQSTLSPSTPTLKAERTPRPLKSGKISSNEAKKVPAKSEEDRKQSSKTKIVTPARNESGVVSAKSTVPTRARLQNKAPKKSTVVPLESKLSKETTTLESKLDANLPLAEEKKTVVEAIDIVSPTPEDHDNDHDVSKLDDDVTPDKVENPDPVLVAVNETEKVNVQENSEEKVEAISSAAWVEEDQERIHSDGSSSCQVAPSDLAAVAAISSRARHSLSQMLQAENGEPEVLEWGNAENPPALVYQKDAPTGLKRLLKFARKSKGEVNLSDRSSPSLISDVDDDSEESKVNGKKSSGKPKSTFSEKTSVDFLDAQEILPAQTGQRSSASSRKLREGQTNKASRSFFSLSSFKSSKTVDPKSR